MKLQSAAGHITHVREELKMRLDSLGQLLEGEIPFAQVHLRAESERLPDGLWRKMSEAGWFDQGVSTDQDLDLAAIALAMGTHGLPAHCAEHFIGLSAPVSAAASGEGRLSISSTEWRRGGQLLVRFAAWSDRAVLFDEGKIHSVALPDSPPLRTIAGEGWLRVRVPSRGESLPAGSALALRRRLSLSRAAEMQGLLQRLFKLTREYVVMRHQFGRPIGAFQALQHRVADMSISVVAVESLLHGALIEQDPRFVWASRLCADAASDKLASDAVQLHGALGLSAEYPVQLLYRRVQMLTLSHEERERLLTLMCE